MKSLFQTLTLLIIACGLVAPLWAQKPADPKPLEAMLDKALAAYNAGDAKAFYADSPKSMASVATPQTFEMMYRGMYFKTYGKYVSRTLSKAESSIFEDTPLLVFAAEFELNKKVKISVNFMKEDGAYKIMQIQFATL